MPPVEFGDFDNDDAFDTALPDPEQVARKLHSYRLERGRESIRWEALSDNQRDILVDIIRRLLAWLIRQGAIR